MPEGNNQNTKKGRDFQCYASSILGSIYQIPFMLEHSIPIGNPAKPHKFDLVSTDHKYVGECKNYSWTEGGNVPSAKMGFINEAVFYLQHLPNNLMRFVVLRRDIDERHKESLADYYYRTNNHLLNGVYLVEIDIETGSIRTIGK